MTQSNNITFTIKAKDTRPSNRRYQLNESFFDSWSAEMAYVLGFWFADGYMKIDRSYRINFYSNDKEILKSIRNILGSNHQIRKASQSNCWVLETYSKHMYYKLIELGGFRNKSKTLSMPFVPEVFLADFIRGYFDGDGSVFYVSYLSTKDNKQRVELRSNFTSGSSLFLNQLMRVLKTELGLAIKQLGIYNQGQSLKLGYGTKDTKKLLAFMYYEGYPIGLQRKAKFIVK